MSLLRFPLITSLFVLIGVSDFVSPPPPPESDSRPPQSETAPADLAPLKVDSDSEKTTS